ncbi:MAG: hypothetical protein JWO03_1345 [Bacteroidetes bacterium]|nr:hypothetical protein [Bacteroidota bacterium]
MKLKTSIIALMMVICSTLMAQEKYEQAIVYHIIGMVVKSIEGKEFEKIKVKGEQQGDYTSIFKELGNMRDEGWEIWNSSISPGGGPVYFLRRKLK